MRTITIEVDEELASDAEALGLDVEATARRGFGREYRSERNRRAWQEANRDSISAMNDWIEKNGLPLEEFRAF